ncbi:MAG: hypothetical protein KKB45_16325 [Gammaproteobacteria bacterium]|nr:hypothetical protein [Gammaproteobacteria bacterium]
MTNTNTNTAISNAHNAAANEHLACAEHHRKAAACQDKGKLEDAKDNASKAMSCCDSASKKSASACAC